jgi:hypothetical protein
VPVTNAIHGELSIRVWTRCQPEKRASEPRGHTYEAPASLRPHRCFVRQSVNNRADGGQAIDLRGRKVAWAL